MLGKEGNGGKVMSTLFKTRTTGYTKSFSPYCLHSFTTVVRVLGNKKVSK